MNLAYSACASQYLRLYQRTWRDGLDQAKLNASRERHTVYEGAGAFVADDASNPTGVALGRALPDERVARRLTRIVDLIARKLSGMVDGPSFAKVRADYYHVTIYNRSHFDHGAVHPMSRTEVEIARALIDAERVRSVALDLNGLLLTPDGRLLARGYPLDENLSRLRQALLGRLPPGGGTPPTLAHVKLGHVLCPLPLEQVRHLCDWLGRVSHHVSARLTFREVYTPHGRIPLGSVALASEG